MSGEEEEQEEQEDKQKQHDNVVKLITKHAPEKEQQQLNKPMEANNIFEHQIEELVTGFREPYSFLQLQQIYPQTSPEVLLNIIESLKTQSKINLLSLYVPHKGKSQSVIIEYFVTEQHPLGDEKSSNILAHQKLMADAWAKMQSNNESHNGINNHLQNSPESTDHQLQQHLNVTSTTTAISDGCHPQQNNTIRKVEDLEDEELVERKKQLIAQKEALEAKKQFYNTKKEKIKKIQEFNQIKEVACTIFERIATVQKRTTKDVCQTFGLDIHAQ